jgi:hypothetical protein
VAFQACRESRVRWFVYAGGFYLDSPSMCIPLVIRIGKRRSVVRLGVGTRCE